jgi:hypothetical protein
LLLWKFFVDAMIFQIDALNYALNGACCGVVGFVIAG